jgi:C_GCAxxG_C_C family probable redox protein
LAKFLFGGVKDMNSKGETAQKYFNSGYNCAQSVFLTFCENYGIDKGTAARMVNVLGGGICKTKNICGALSASCLVMSARCGKKSPDEPERQDATYANGYSIIESFKSEFGATDCPSLLGYDISDPAQMEEAAETDAFHRICGKYVYRAAELAAEYTDKD